MIIVSSYNKNNLLPSMLTVGMVQAWVGHFVTPLKRR
jgi:hypothetical protein